MILVCNQMSICNARDDQLCTSTLSLCISQALSNVMTKTCLCYFCFHIQRAMYFCLYCCV
jgi:hypothetical protein